MPSRRGHPRFDLMPNRVIIAHALRSARAAYRIPKRGQSIPTYGLASFLPKHSKLTALSALAKTMIEKRGRLNHEDIDRFLAAGFSKEHALEVIAAISASTITNYTCSITKPPLDPPFQAYAWVG